MGHSMSKLFVVLLFPIVAFSQSASYAPQVNIATANSYLS